MRKVPPLMAFNLLSRDAGQEERNGDKSLRREGGVIRLDVIYTAFLSADGTILAPRRSPLIHFVAKEEMRFKSLPS